VREALDELAYHCFGQRKLWRGFHDAADGTFVPLDVALGPERQRV
jgi:hypothetical protein